jgi:hypothetical protein
VGSTNREERVIINAVGIVTDKHVHPILVRTVVQPGRIKVTNNGTGIHKVSIVKVMIIVESVSKIFIWIAISIGSGRDDTSPDSVINQGKLLLVINKVGECGLEFLETSMCKSRVTTVSVASIDDGRELGESL